MITKTEIHKEIIRPIRIHSWWRRCQAARGGCPTTLPRGTFCAVGAAPARLRPVYLALEISAQPSSPRSRSSARQTHDESQLGKRPATQRERLYPGSTGGGQELKGKTGGGGKHRAPAGEAGGGHLHAIYGAVLSRFYQPGCSDKTCPPPHQMLPAHAQDRAALSCRSAGAT